MNETDRKAAVARVIARGSDPAAIAEAEGDFGPGGAFASLAENQMNDYERACDRFNSISGSIGEIQKTARFLIQWTEEEYDAAQANLRQYESQPGVPLPQYRTPARADWFPGDAYDEVQS